MENVFSRVTKRMWDALTHDWKSMNAFPCNDEIIYINYICCLRTNLILPRTLKCDRRRQQRRRSQRLHFGNFFQTLPDSLESKLHAKRWWNNEIRVVNCSSTKRQASCKQNASHCQCIHQSFSFCRTFHRDIERRMVQNEIRSFYANSFCGWAQTKTQKKMRWKCSSYSSLLIFRNEFSLSWWWRWRWWNIARDATTCEHRTPNTIYHQWKSKRFLISFHDNTTKCSYWKWIDFEMKSTNENDRIGCAMN